MRGERPSPRFPMRSSASWASGVRHAGGPWRCMMAHSLAGADKFHEEFSGDYRFARTHVKRGNRMRSALWRVNGCLKTMIEAIADLKVRRMRRDLALRDIRSIRTAITGWCANPGRWSVHNEVARSHLAPSRRQGAGDILRPFVGWAGQAIPSRGALHARPWAEISGKAQSWARVVRLNAKPRYGYAQHSCEVDTGSHSNLACADCVDLSAVENASKQEFRASVLIESEPIML